ncbi:hypothetical protein Y1Q_0021122 [Alligator mississippiensis]|uniref:Uncharacterized protein n=1 Tax=Alligator mississippiensis TaxID=8496 RepID=A0A151NSP5_ALLMI|nr:hypothetical protein Y1Q_0021122 [Alligator mississippiensis]
MSIWKDGKRLLAMQVVKGKMISIQTYQIDKSSRSSSFLPLNRKHRIAKNDLTLNTIIETGIICFPQLGLEMP